MKINILSPLKKRYYTIFKYIKQVKRIIELNPNIEFTWIVNDNSKDPAYKRIIEDAGVKCVYTDDGGVEEDYEYKDNSDELSKFVAKTMNRMVNEMPPCDYALLIEDDIVCTTENPIPYLLNGFTEGVGAVSACIFAKRLTNRFGIIQAIRRDGTTCTNPEYKKSGYEKVDGTSFGFIMFRYDLLGKDPFIHNYNGTRFSVDIGYGLKLKDMGYSINYCWDIKIRHYFRTKDGVVGFADENNRKFKDNVKLVVKQWHRKASPLFLQVPENLKLTEEVVADLLKGKQLW